MTRCDSDACILHVPSAATRGVVIALGIALGGCNIRELAGSIAQTIIPVDDGGTDGGPPAKEASLEGRLLAEPVAWPSTLEQRCTLRGRLCVRADDSDASEALVAVAEGVEARLDGLDIPMQTALFGAGPITFLVGGSGGVRSLGRERTTARPRLAPTLSPSDGTEEALLERLLELHVLQRNPAVTATDATSMARAFSLRWGLVPPPVDPTPEAAVLGATHADAAGSDGRFLAWLDERLSPAAGSLLGAALSKAWRGDDGVQWRTAGDPWFVLARNFSGQDDGAPKLDELLLRHAIEVSSTADGRSALPFRWDEPLPKKARRLLSVRPVEPTGVTWMRFEREAEHPSASLVIALDWEEHARFRVFAQLLDAEGRMIRTHRFGAPVREPHVEATLESLDGVASIVIGAINLGDPAAPFDPREGPWEPHAFLLTVAPMNGDGGFL